MPKSLFKTVAAHTRYTSTCVGHIAGTDNGDGYRVHINRRGYNLPTRACSTLEEARKFKASILKGLERDK